jgi:hypothetical protein
MDRFTRLFAALEQIFGKGFVSRLMGKQSNVITLPSKDAQRFLNKELNIAEASEAAVKKGIEDLEKLVSDTKKISLINDQELLTLTNNAERVAARSPKIPLPPVAKKPADVVDITTKEKISPEGIMQLKEQAGQVSPPGTMMGNIESKINKLKASVKEMDTGANMDTIMADALKSQQGFKKLQDQGLVTAATREILQRDIKAGKIKLPKEIEDRIMLVEGNPGRVDPIQIFREQYGEDALEQVDSLVPDLAKAKSYKDLLNVVDKKYTIKPRSSTIPQTMSAEDAAKAEKDLGIKTLKDDIEDPEGFAAGGRVGMAKGGITALKTLINFLAKNRKNYFLEKNLGKVQGPTTGSKSLQALNPKSLGYKQNFLTKEMDQQYLDNRIDYFKNLQNVIKNDRELLINMKALPKEHQDKFYKMINEGGNKGRLDIYNKIDIDDAIMDIEQIIKNAEFKNLSEEAVKRKLNSEGGSQGLDYLMGIERRGYAGGSTLQEGVVSGFTRLKNPNGAPGNYNEFMYEGPDGQIYGAETYSSIAAGMYPNIYKPTTTPDAGTPGGLITDGDNKYVLNADGRKMISDSMVKAAFGDNAHDGDDIKRVFGENLTFVSDDYLKNYIQQQSSVGVIKQQTPTPETPTEDFSDYLNTSSVNTIAQTTPETPTEDFSDYLNTAEVPREDAMVSPEDALTPPTPDVNPLQQHLDFNEFLKGQGLSQQDYNVLGGRDVAQNLAPGNPILGGVVNLASPFYNLLQTFDSAKDAQGNVIKQYVPDMYEDGTESGAYYDVPAQNFLDIPGSAARNIQGGLGILTNTQKQQYQDLRNQYETQRQQDQQNYQQRIAQVDPNALNTQYLQKLQNPNATNMDQFKSQLQSNLTPTPMNTGGRVGYADGSMNILPDSANNPFYSGWEPSSSSTTSTPNTVDQLNNAILYSNFVNQTDTGSNDTTDTSTNYSNNFNQDQNAKSMYSNYYMDNLGFGDIFGGVTGLVAKAFGYPDIGYAIQANNPFGDNPGMSYGASNRSGAVDTQDYGREADNVSNGGVSASEAGMGDGMSDLADGGRVGYAGGGTRPQGLNYLMGY